jgi:hypothetical protein
MGLTHIGASRADVILLSVKIVAQMLVVDKQKIVKSVQPRERTPKSCGTKLTNLSMLELEVKNE